MCMLLHKWGQWAQYEEYESARQITTRYMLSAVVHYRQRRVCQKCGKVQDEFIRMKIVD